ncbi:hypothetical protein EZV62_018236 [Acer yangbiense]|uniref:SWIM-type domain-containing protein n=1 Tax=Acer yangbiense TaxID=1000413 RepID=A0A5C7HIR4_9ROSI|nr:hypothetical protein EZV62_018236 [Acer yangbiense]
MISTKYQDSISMGMPGLFLKMSYLLVLNIQSLDHWCLEILERLEQEYKTLRESLNHIRQGDDKVLDAISVDSDSEEIVEVDNVRVESGVDVDEHVVDDEMNEVHGTLAVVALDEDDMNVNLELFEWVYISEEARSKWISSKFETIVKNNPDIKCGVITDLLKEQFNVTVDVQRLYKAKKRASIVFSNEHHVLVILGDMHSWCNNYCARHIYANFRKTYSTKKLKDLFWEASRAYDVHVFKRAMTDISIVSVGAKAWLEEIEPKHWSRHAFEPSIKCDHVTNNVTETFNSLLGDYMVRTYLNLLEYIRRLVMIRFQQRKEDCTKWKSKFPLTVNKKIVKASLKSRILKIIHVGEGEYEVLGLTRAHTAKLKSATCECGQWQISGVPCSHALVGIRNFYRLGGAKERLIDFTHPSLSKSDFETTYHSMIHLIPDLCAWVDIEVQSVNPPPLQKKPDRPKLLRIRESCKKPKATRCGSVICAKCKQPGYNKRTCKGVDAFRSNKRVAKGALSS